MSSNEVYNLRWNDYQSTLSNSVGTLLDDSDFVDVTLACEGQSFNAHKVVLSACSAYLKKLLKRNPCKHPIIILKDVRANVLHSLVHFMYHGAVDVPEEQLSEFLSAAQGLEVKGLAEDDAQFAPPKSQNVPRHEAPPPPKRQRMMNISSRQSSGNSGSSNRVAQVISAERARSMVQSGSFTPERSSSSMQGADAFEKLHSGEVSITPSASVSASAVSSGNIEGGLDSCDGVREDSRDIQVKQEDDESDLEIVEQDSSMKYEGSDLSSLGADADLPTSFQGSLPLDFPPDSPGPSQASQMMEGASSGFPMRGHVCTFCGHQFKRPIELQRHIERKHVMKPVAEWDSCNYCGKLFKTKNNLQSHLNNVHRVYASKRGQLAFNYDNCTT